MTEKPDDERGPLAAAAMAAEPEPSARPSTRRGYEPPELIEYGSVSALTHGGLSKKGDFGPVAGFRAFRN